MMHPSGGNCGIVLPIGGHVGKKHSDNTVFLTYLMSTVARAFATASCSATTSHATSVALAVSWCMLRGSHSITDCSSSTALSISCA